VGDSGIGAQCRYVEELADSPGTESDEPLKARQISNLADSSDIPLDIRFEIVTERLMRIQRLIAL